MTTIRKYLFVLFGFIVICGQANAHGISSVEIINKSKGWTPIQMGIFPFNMFRTTVDVYGLNLNGLINDNFGNVYGISLAPFHLRYVNETSGLSVGVGAGISRHVGLLICAYSRVEDNCGLQIGLMNFSGESRRDDIRNGGGIQLGVYNQAESGLQIGLLNHNPNAYFRMMILVNWSKNSESVSHVPGLYWRRL